ncbi:MAG: LLM class flavin-dependent oxidoreductase [Ktedonobacteraceae bacterium]|nr:LLM class flavin-dependent oxidoreductase [Ktedonobacteraceae bacterium]
MKKSVQFGLALPSGPRPDMAQQAYVDNVQRGLDLVRDRFDSAWFIDHLQYGDQPLLEAWTIVTYWAALYPQLKFGHVVLCQSFRNPALLAKMAATLQYLTGGRFVLGIGAGWKEDEYRSYGYDFPQPRVRVEQLDEALQVVKALWAEKQATVRGKYYQVVDAYCEPKPDPAPVVMIGGTRPRMLRLIARHADWWNVSWCGLESYRKLVKECERACAEAGRDPTTLRRTWYGGCVCAPTEAEVKALNVTQLSTETAFVGTPAQIVEQMQRFVALGVDYFQLNWGVWNSFPDPTTPELLVQEVLPALNS